MRNISNKQFFSYKVCFLNVVDEYVVIKSTLEWTYTWVFINLTHPNLFTQSNKSTIDTSDRIVSVSVLVSVQTKPKFRYFGLSLNFGFGRSLVDNT